ncbi:MAG TPA: hypothetical protein DCM05_17725 [Elusimicrobia bacterium]|nr:hypothetical protein [Elusimicrobiota bacterium]
MRLPVARLAWRSLWRSKRRTLLMASSIAFGVAAIVFGQSLLSSFQRQMVDKSTGVFTGHLQVQAKDATDRKFPDKLLEAPERFKALFAADPRVAAAGTRLLLTALLHSAASSRGALVVGVEPEDEKRLSLIPGYLKTGRYVSGPRDIVIGRRLASTLDLRLGERVVVMSQGPDGVMQSELFRLSGILDTGSVTFDGQIAYVRLDAAQGLKGRPGQASQVVAKLKDSRRTDEAAADLGFRLGDPRAALFTYEQLDSEVVGIKRFQDAFWVVISLVILLVVWLGILNTVSMSFFERIREFGVMRAIGARPSLLVSLLLAEALFLGALGAVLGLALGRGLIAWFGSEGLRLPVGQALAYFMPFDDRVFLRPVWGQHLRAAAAAAGVSVLAAVGPALRVLRLRVTEALRYL